MNHVHEFRDFPFETLHIGLGDSAGGHRKLSQSIVLGFAIHSACEFLSHWFSASISSFDLPPTADADLSQSRRTIRLASSNRAGCEIHAQFGSAKTGLSDERGFAQERCR